jgi:hypothetical protein
MSVRNSRTFSDTYHRQIALHEDGDVGAADFAALLDDYCRRVNEEPESDRRSARRPRSAHA